MTSSAVPLQDESAHAADPAVVADVMRPVLTAVLGRDLPIRYEFWDGSAIAAADAVATLRFTSPDALRRIVWSPDQLGLARAYVAGDIEIDGDVFRAASVVREALAARGSLTHAARAIPDVIAAARRLGALGRPLPPPPEEARLAGWRHSLRRDRRAIRHHYDVGNDFFGLVLGPTMTYSSARFTDDGTTLEEAQAAKHELVCRKLGLHERPGRLLDVGCGWGSMAIHAATHHGAQVVGVTISAAQAELARRRVDAAGVADRVEIRLQDYRELTGEQFDAICSIGMFEAVGGSQVDRYFTTLHRLLAPQGRLLNHAISAVGGTRLGRRSFIGRYVFPDGELIDVGATVAAMQRAGFEVRDVESLREHYVRTLRAWVANLEAGWDRAVELVGRPRAKVWRLYMAGSAVAFEVGRNSVHQVLGVVAAPGGASGFAPTRRSWEG